MLDLPPPKPQGAPTGVVRRRKPEAKPVQWEFNPPTVDWQRGGYNRRDGFNSPSRDVVINAKNVPKDKITGGNRAYMYQAIDKQADWYTATTVTDSTREIKARTPVLGPKRYGFQFHYNPVQIDFVQGVSLEVDLSMLTSQTEKGQPWGESDSAPTISMNLTLNRVEDMNILTEEGFVQGDVVNYYGADPYGGKVSPEVGREIYARGTGIDLEYLFRCVLGKSYPTVLRGDTADIGIMYSLPQYLILGERLKYIGRLTGLRYKHMMFVRDLVPVYTTLDLSFQRYPDATITTATPSVSLGSRGPGGGVQKGTVPHGALDPDRLT